MEKIRLAILGCSGSIGQSALRVAADNADKIDVALLANDSNLTTLLAQNERFKPRLCWNQRHKLQLLHGKEVTFSENLITTEDIYKDIDVVINGIGGLSGLAPSVAVLRAGKGLPRQIRRVL